MAIVAGFLNPLRIAAIRLLPYDVFERATGAADTVRYPMAAGAKRLVF
jgi:hypothetical protein